MKRISLLLLASVLSLAPLAAANAYDRIYVRNKCYKDVTVLFLINDPADSKWKTRGWQEVPGDDNRQRAVKATDDEGDEINHDHGSQLYIYAETTSENNKGYWRGGPNSIRRWHQGDSYDMQPAGGTDSDENTIVVLTCPN